MSEEYLERYRAYLETVGLRRHAVGALVKLGEAEEELLERGLAFNLNSEVLFSYDVCGGCEAHAVLLNMASNPSYTVRTAPTLVQLDEKTRSGNVNFVNCP